MIENVDETVFNEINVKYLNGVISYQFNEKCSQFVQKIINNFLKNKNIQKIFFKPPQGFSLRDLRLQGLIKFFYDELSLKKSEVDYNKISVLPMGSGLSNAKQEYLFEDNKFYLDNPVMFCGTFDRLHIGHKYSILCSFLIANSYLYLGVVNRDLTNKKHSQLIQTYNERVENIQKYILNLSESTNIKINITLLDKYAEPETIKNNQAYLDVVIYPLESTLGPAEYTKTEFYLVVTEQSYKGGLAVNEFRMSKNLLPWPLITMPLVGDPAVSSTDLRNKLINNK